MYSQHDEEFKILEWFIGKKSDGRFLDIGAYDGKTFSNTRALFELGWSGVFVEPAAIPFRALVDEYGSNPKATLVNAAITGATMGFQPFWQTPDAVSTSNVAHKTRWEKAVPYTETHLFLVPYERLIGAFPGPYDFINVDVEGGNLDLFRAVIARDVGASLLCVEYEAHLNEVVELADGRGYEEVHRTTENLILGRKA